MNRIKTMLPGFALALAIIAGNALASSADFKNRHQINLGVDTSGNNITADLLTVSQDRFIITLDLSLQSLTFIDTWNWRVLSPSLSLAVGSTSSVEDMAINPAQTSLYLSATNGVIWKLDLSPLAGIQFNGTTDTPRLSLEQATTVFSGDNLIDIKVISPAGSSTVDCLFAQIQRLSSEELSWMIFRGDTVLLTAPAPLLAVDTIIEASASPNLLLAKYFLTPLAETILYGYRCQPYEFEPIYLAALTLLEGGNHFQAIAISPNSDKFVIGNIGNPAGSLAQFELYGLDQLLWNTWFDQYDVSTTGTFMPLRFKDFSSEGGEPILFFARDDDFTLNVLELASDTAFGEVGSTVKFSAVIRNLADSSSADGVVYAGMINHSTVDVITPNPFVKSLSTSGTGSSDTITLTISYDKSGPRPPKTFTVAECPAFSISPAGCSRIIINNQTLSGTGTEVVALSSQSLGECLNVLGVFIEDGNTPVPHRGRNAIQISVDTPPPAQSFELGFWDQTIVFEFTAQELCDLKSFEIYYGTSPTSPPSGGDPGDAASPIVISNADPGKDYRIEVRGLANGTVYYGQIIAKDLADNATASEIRQTMPQPVKKYSDTVNEKGGFSCAITAGGRGFAPASELALILFPWLMLLFLKIKSRSAR